MNKKVLLVSSLLLSIGGYAQQDSLALENDQEKEKVLQTVELIGRARKDYNSEYSFSASKIALKNMEVSQAITTVTKELLSDRGVTRLSEAVKNVSGVTQTSFYSQYAVRGVTQSSTYRENRLINGMLTSTYFFTQPLVMNVERVEVIKGPASMTFSSTDAGGSINIVTKKPLRTNRKEASFSVGSYGSVIAAIDFTGPLNRDKSLLYRLNIGYENSQSFRDLQFKKAYIIAPTVTYIPNEKTRVNFEFVLTDNNNRLDRGQPIIRANKGEKPALNSTPIHYAIGSSNDYNKNIDVNVLANLTHKFTDNIGLNLSYMKQIWNEDLVETRTDNKFARNAAGGIIPTKVQMRYVQRQQKFFTDNFNAYLNVDWKLDEIKNKSVLGYDIIDSEVSQSGGWNEARGYKLIDGGIANSYKASKSHLYVMDEQGNPVPNVPHWDLTKKGQYKMANPSDYTLNRRRGIIPMHFTTNGIYFMNQMEWDKFIFSFGLRHEWYVDQNYYKQGNKEVKVKQNKFLKRLGLIYKATGNINIYGAYVEGFQMQTDAYLGTSNFRMDANGDVVRDPFDPKTSKMLEAGVKTEWLNGRLNANIAYYNIQQKNVLTYDDGVGMEDELMSQGALERNQGIEVDVMGRILPNWMINAGYAWMDPYIRNKGTKYRKDNAPRHSFNLWTRYDIKEGVFRDFGIGTGINYVDEKISWQEQDLVTPAYTLVDAAVYYKLKNMQVAVNVNNVFNKEYWLGAFNYPRLFPGTPRNIMLNIKYNF